MLRFAVFQAPEFYRASVIRMPVFDKTLSKQGQAVLEILEHLKHAFPKNLEVRHAREEKHHSHR
jgi:hypothetical protein